MATPNFVSFLQLSLYFYFFCRDPRFDLFHPFESFDLLALTARMTSVKMFGIPVGKHDRLAWSFLSALAALIARMTSVKVSGTSVIASSYRLGDLYIPAITSSYQLGDLYIPTIASSYRLGNLCISAIASSCRLGDLYFSAFAPSCRLGNLYLCFRLKLLA